MRLCLLAHPATAAMRSGRFPDDDPLDPRGLEEAAGFARGFRLRARTTVLRSPAACARQTADACGVDAATEAALADVDYGTWRGRAIKDVAATEIDAWLCDPRFAAHGGESLADVAVRVGAWLDGLNASGDDMLAITHAAVIRAAVAHALGAPDHAMFRIEVAPLARVVLTRSARGWVWSAAESGI
ncbi:histidine phosphatase family protein [Paraburkholderia caballeronis]|uniref:Broad specificity phosphatase PhoE n=2 Tax=Paraburkholderia caballeronis TaxID=416943 RepID=A0A1H7NN33_9BURK|nr:histidine phosphatase family protein [Paraburkholderia caballeronis]PXW25607.1 broad specificity phosphatase PhoE [Paraburkholderia caballeronis]PXX01214.1 broad specificity phosphatase PhoE [Paraburkholderia caballeronis]RAJ99433.1 broad specificity phosphatase PhoE [Paraburkholderia caballeronis]SEE30414.1 Broad specificity phosphatase PhoE [Paraburkholderia caballeronis]SEL24942.1 Broad specificity phosphatase PhoE [Paraburkholderia caballeronis]